MCTNLRARRKFCLNCYMNHFPGSNHSRRFFFCLWYICLFVSSFWTNSCWTKLRKDIQRSANPGTRGKCKQGNFQKNVPSKMKITYSFGSQNRLVFLRWGVKNPFWLSTKHSGTWFLFISYANAVLRFKVLHYARKCAKEIGPFWIRSWIRFCRWARISTRRSRRNWKTVGGSIATCDGYQLSTRR